MILININIILCRQFLIQPLTCCEMSLCILRIKSSRVWIQHQWICITAENLISKIVWNISHENVKTYAWSEIKELIHWINTIAERFSLWSYLLNSTVLHNIDEKKKSELQLHQTKTFNADGGYPLTPLVLTQSLHLNCLLQNGYMTELTAEFICNLHSYSKRSILHFRLKIKIYNR